MRFTLRVIIAYTIAACDTFVRHLRAGRSKYEWSLIQRSDAQVRSRNVPTVRVLCAMFNDLNGLVIQRTTVVICWFDGIRFRIFQICNLF